MEQFLDDLMGYLGNCFSEDPDITDTVSVELANANKKPKPPRITVEMTGDSDDTRYATLARENAAKVDIQITAYTGQMSIGGAVYAAQRCAAKFAEKIKNAMRKEIVSLAIPAILNVRRVGHKSPFPQESGANIYMTPLRFEIQIAYKSIIPNNNGIGFYVVVDEHGGDNYHISASQQKTNNSENDQGG